MSWSTIGVNTKKQYDVLKTFMEYIRLQVGKLDGIEVIFSVEFEYFKPWTSLIKVTQSDRYP